MGSQFWNTLFFSGIGGLATLVGAYLLYFSEEWAKKNSVFFLSFSGGVVLTIAFTHLLPEAMEINQNVLGVVLFTLIGYYVLEHTIAIHTCSEGDCHVHHIGIPAFVGFGLHSIVDGIQIGVGFEVGYTVGVATAVAIFLHQLPVGITLSALLRQAGFSKARSVFMRWVVSLAIPLGAVVSYFFMKGMGTNTLGLFLAFGAGSFIYFGASHLLPETHKNTSRANIVLVLAGVALVYIMVYLKGGS
ncbi:MAG: ZIP family metal transporter [Deltaproteobacteria bacterium]|nr:ZIP family metal transporter [Deltaproteobacteria bacterium]